MCKNYAALLAELIELIQTMSLTAYWDHGQIIYDIILWSQENGVLRSCNALICTVLMAQRAVLASVVTMALPRYWPFSDQQESLSCHGKQGKLCSVWFQKSVPAARLQSPRRPVNLHVYWCFLVTDSGAESENTFIPVDLLSLLLLVATVFPPG